MKSTDNTSEIIVEMTRQSLIELREKIVALEEEGRDAALIQTYRKLEVRCAKQLRSMLRAIGYGALAKYV
jgi:hypothetical protein